MAYGCLWSTALMSKKNYTENHIWCHREVARVLQTYQSAWKSYAKKLVPQISGQLGHFSNDEICNFDSKVTIKIAQTNSIQIVDLSKMLIFPKKSICPINSHMFGSSNHDQSWLVVEKKPSWHWQNTFPTHPRTRSNGFHRCPYLGFSGTLACYMI